MEDKVRSTSSRSSKPESCDYKYKSLQNPQYVACYVRDEMKENMFMCDAEDVLAVEVEMKLRPPNELNIRPPTLKHQEISRTFVRRPHISLQLKYRSHCAAHNDVRLTTFPILGILKLGIIYWRHALR